MRNFNQLLIVSVAFLVGAAASSRADAQSTDLERLREALRQAISQSREFQDQTIRLAAERDQAQKEKQALAEQLQAAVNQLAESGRKAANDGARETNAALLREMADRVRDQEKALKGAGETLLKWQAAYKNATDVAQAKTLELRQLKAEIERSTDTIQACVDKNQNLVKIAYESLNLYDSKNFWSFVKESEPLTGLKRVEIENILQDYEDKIRDQSMLTRKDKAP